MEIWSNHRHALGKGNAKEDIQVEVRKVLIIMKARKV